MNIKCRWIERMKFEASTHEHKLLLDAKQPLGSNAAMSPKELVISALCGCTGMDVVGLLKKHRQAVDDFAIEAVVTMSVGEYPIVFEKIQLIYRMEGPIDAHIAREAVELSQSRYCSISAMLSKAVHITYTVELNGEAIAQGKADFA